MLTTGIDDPFEGLAYQGLARAVRKLGIQGRALTAGPREGEAPTMAYLARLGYDLVIGFGALQREALGEVAHEHPDTTFLALDERVEALPHRPQNVQGTLFKVEEGAFLAGYLAASMERRRPGSDAVSSVGGLKVAQVDRFIAGFEAGARRARPGLRAFHSYANEFLDPGRCRAVALRQIARGSGVVFQVAGFCGRGALAAARDTGRFGVGVDVDQSGLGPHVLTSVLKRLDVAIFRGVLALRNGTFRTGVNVAYGLRDRGVGLGKISPRVPPDAVAELAAVRRLIVSGRLPEIPTKLAPSTR